MTKYTVQTENGVTAIFGDVPLEAFSQISKIQTKTAVMDVHLARLMGATMAFGEPSACDAMKTKLIADKLQGAPATGRWKEVGEHGNSSLFLYEALSLRVTSQPPASVQVAHPHDAGDLRRCRLMLEMEPGLAAYLKDAGGLSPIWDRIIDHWDELCKTMDEECPQWRTGGGSAKLTTEMLRRITQES